MSSKPNLGVDQLGEVRFSKTRKQAKQQNTFFSSNN